MAEMVAGVGHQKSMVHIAEIADGELRKKRGVPKHMHLHSNGIELEAERTDWDEAFTRFTLRVAANGDIRDRLVQRADELGDVCTHSIEDDRVVLYFNETDGGGGTGGRDALDTVAAELELPEVWRFDGSHYQTEPIDMEMLFHGLLQYHASDVHLTPGLKPIFRVDNQAHVSDVMAPLSSAQIHDLIKRVAPDRDYAEFEKNKQCSFNYHQTGLGYARASAFIKSGSPHMTFRYLPEQIPSFEDLHVPPEMMKKLAATHDGLVLIAGMTGSGKTTTCAALLDWINRHRACHILTIEDPVEYVHQNKKAFISQRSLGEDVNSFAEAVEGALRHDPDVILIGEMRDADTIRSAISAASTGHLVLTTLHSNNASGAINRIVSFFDPVERDLVRMQLQDSLRCVICQKLLPKKGGGRVPALEVLFNDIKHISKGIIAGDTLQIRLGMQQTLSDSMMFEHYIHEMYKDDLITLETAKEGAPDLDMFEQIQMGTYSVPRIQERH